MCFECPMSLEGLFKRIVDGVDVVHNFSNVPISGVFAFYELELSPSWAVMVSDDVAVGPECVSNRADEVGSVVCRSIVCRKDVFRHGVFWFRCVSFVVL